MKTNIILASLALLFSACQKPQDTAAESTAGSPSVMDYPLSVCLVSGEELGSMGDPVVIVHEGQQIKFCCDKCRPKFEEDPEKYLSKLSSQ